jgi:hypothetical protein
MVVLGFDLHVKTDAACIAAPILAVEDSQLAGRGWVGVVVLANPFGN